MLKILPAECVKAYLRYADCKGGMTELVSFEIKI